MQFQWNHICGRWIGKKGTGCEMRGNSSGDKQSFSKIWEMKLTAEMEHYLDRS